MGIRAGFVYKTEDDLITNNYQLERGLSASQFRHREVQQDQADRLAQLPETLDGLDAVLRQLHGIACLLEHTRRQCSHRLVVIHHQYGAHTPEVPLGQCLSAAPPSGHCRAEHRQQHSERGPLVRLAPYPDSAAMTPHDSQRSGEAQAPAQKLGGEEGLEDPVPGLLVHTLTGIDHVHPDVVALGDGKPGSAEPLPALDEGLGPDPYGQRSRPIADSLAAVDDQDG
jgi:hypothetical protein